MKKRKKKKKEKEKKKKKRKKEGFLARFLLISTFWWGFMNPGRRPACLIMHHSHSLSA